MTAPRIAVNPIPYWSRDGAGKSQEVLRRRRSPTSPRSGSPRSRPTCPTGMTAGGVPRLDRPATGSRPRSACSTPRSTRPIDIADEIERAKAFAADPARAGAGPDHGLVGRRAGPDASGRRSAPTSAATGWPWRSRTAASSARSCSPRVCGRCTTPTSAGSSRPSRRSAALLDELGPDVIGFGPDTGHLRWAGIDPAAFITRYADRIGAHPPQGLLPRLSRRPRPPSPSYRELSRSQAAVGRAGTRGGRLRRRAGRACRTTTTATS